MSVMVGLILMGTTPLNAQERVVPSEPFYADSLGWFFTDAMVEDLAQDAKKIDLLERRILAMEELLALKDWQIETERSYRNVYDGLIEETKEAYQPTFWQKVPDVIWVSTGLILGVVLTK